MVNPYKVYVFNKYGISLEPTSSSTSPMTFTSTEHARGDNAKFLGYGTAGFRAHADLLDSFIPYRVGIVACLRSIYHKSATIGVMITASHNPPQDNGVKIIEPDGSMLIESWEGLARDLANTPDSNLDEKIKQISSEHKLELDHPCCVYIGYDTRATSVKFAKAVEAGVSKFKNGKSKNWGLCTTPLVHYYVACDSSRNDEVPYGVCSESGYYKKLGKAFEKLIELTGNKNSGQKVLVDCANGIGSKMLAKFDGTLKNSYFEAINDGSAGELNSLCGADFVKVKQNFPTGKCFQEANRRFAVFDGDADRIMYFWSENGTFKLLDGDKLASLLSKQISAWLREAGLKINLGVVQTAYANGASTNFLREACGEEALACAKTGVKHVHHKALDYDIGVYFEANGHGTIIFKELVKKQIRESGHEKLINFVDLVNETVGDALSIMLAIEICLLENNWSIADWSNMYTELPSRLCKVTVTDRTAIKTFDEERQVCAPAELQPAINEKVKQVSGGRSFVRPSGTEDAVRVYAEAETREACDDLAIQIAKLVHQLGGGEGEFPEKLF